MNYFLAMLCFLMTAAAQTAGPTQTDFVFTIQLEKQVFKPGEMIPVLAFLRNQSGKDIYVPHAMSSCSGYESEVAFSVEVVKGKLSLHGRGCGVGGSCSHCMSPQSFEQRIRTTWVLLHPGEVFGARIDSFVDAPDSPGTYKLKAEYLPKWIGHETGTIAGSDISVIARGYEADPLQFSVR